MKKTETAYALAKSDFYFFCRWMFLKQRGSHWIRAKHHELICQALERVYNGECKRLIINIPPRYSKTLIAVVNFIAWCFGKNPDCEFIHVSYGATLAENNSVMIREMITHEEYQKIFPDTVLSTERATHWRTTAGGVLYTTGSGGALTGFGAGKTRDGFGGAIIVDDIHKADEALSDTMRNRAINWFQNTLESRKNSRETPIIVIMQRLHEVDLSGWLLDGGNGEDWEHLCLPAILDGQALWEQKHTLEELRRMEDASPYVFASQYMQSPAPLEGGIFKPGQIEVIDALPVGDIRWVRGWDLASSTDGDFTAGAKIGRLPDGRYIIADMVRERYTTDKRDDLLYNTATLDGKRCTISLPQDPGQAGKSLALYLTRKLAGFPVRTSRETGDKVTRAQPFASQVNVGNVLMLRGSWNIALQDEMKTFPNGKHDDQIDALSRSFNEFIETKRPLNIVF